MKREEKEEVCVVPTKVINNVKVNRFDEEGSGIPRQELKKGQTMNLY